MYGWLTFYHQGHEVAKDFNPHMLELQSRRQKVEKKSRPKYTQDSNSRFTISEQIFWDANFVDRACKVLNFPIGWPNS